MNRPGRYPVVAGLPANSSRASPLLLLIWLLLAAGCATQPPISSPADEAIWLAHQARVEALSDWQVQGRVAISREQEGWNANFDWQQRGDEYRIRLRGPFGQGAIELHGNPAGVWLKQKDKLPVYARDADALLEAEIGWRLPVAGLSSWLRGLPETDTPATFDWDAEGHLRRLTQANWDIDYRRYQAVDELSLPDRLRLSRDSLLVKVVIDHWQIQ